MSESFDPYREWLKVTAETRPPHHYDLLGLPLYETDTDKIDEAYRRRYALVRKYQVGERSAFALQLVTELSKAHDCLTDEESKQAYDGQLREQGIAEKHAPAKVETESKPAEPEKPQVAAGPVEKRVDAVWYLKTVDGLRFGPMTREELDEQVRNGNISAKCQVFRDGWPQPRWAHEVYAQLSEPEKAPASAVAAVASVASSTTTPDAAQASYKLLNPDDSAKKWIPLAVGGGVGGLVLIVIIIVLMNLGKKGDDQTADKDDAKSRRIETKRKSNPGKTTKVEKNPSTSRVDFRGSPTDWTEQRRFRGYQAVAVSKSGKWLAIGNDKGEVRIWDLVKDQFVQTLSADSQPIRQLAFPDDDATLFASSGDTVMRWTWPKGEGRMQWRQSKIKPGEGEVISFCVSPDAKRLLTAHVTQMTFWHLDRSKTQAASMYSPRLVNQVVHHPVDARIAQASLQGPKISTPEDRVVFKSLSSIYQATSTVAFNSAGDRLLLVTSGKAFIWDLNRDAVVQTIDIPEGNYRTSAFSIDGNEIFLGSDNGQIHRYFLSDRQARYPIHDGHAIHWIVPHPDGQRIVSCSTDVVRIWQRGPGGRQQLVFDRDVKAAPSEMAVHFPTLFKSNDTAKSNTDLAKSDTTKKGDGPSKKGTNVDPTKKGSADNKPAEPVWAVETRLKHLGVTGTYCLAFHPTNDSELVSGHEQGLLMWKDFTSAPTPLATNVGRVRTVAFSRGGDRVAFGHGKNVSILTLSTRETTSIAQTRAATSLSFSPQDAVLVTAEIGKSLRIWNPLATPTIRQVNGHPRVLAGVAFHPTDGRMAAVGLDNKVRVYDGQGNLVGTWTSNQRVTIHDLAWNHDGKLLATATSGQIILWNNDGSVLRDLQRPGNSLGKFQNVAFHPKRNLVAGVISGERVVRIWDADSGKIVAELKGPTSPITSLSFNAAGDRIACGCQGPEITIWKYDGPAVSNRIPSNQGEMRVLVSR